MKMEGNEPLRMLYQKKTSFDSYNVKKVVAMGRSTYDLVSKCCKKVIFSDE